MGRPLHPGVLVIGLFFAVPAAVGLLLRRGARTTIRPRPVRLVDKSRALVHYRAVTSTSDPAATGSVTTVGPRPWVLPSVALALPGVAAAVASIGGFGALAVILLVLGVALHLGGSWRGAFSNLPAAAVLITVGLVTVAQACAIGQWPLLASTAGSRALLTVMGLGLAVWAWRHGRQAQPPPPWRASGWSLVPAGLMAAYGAAYLVLPLPRRVEWFLGGDNVRHLWLAAEEGWRGYLEYSVQTSPRAWHTVLVTAWRVGGGGQDGAGLVSLVSTMATSLWFGYALLVLAVSLTAERVANRVGVTRSGGAVVGLLVGSAVLWPAFLANYMVLGFETAIFCALVMATAGLELASHSGEGRCVVVCAAAATAVAHTWQLMLPAAGVVVLAAAWAYLRPPAPRGPRVALVVAAAVVAFSVSAPSLRALFLDVGFERASIQGVPAPSIGVWLPVALGGALLALALQRDLTTRVLAVVSLGTAALAVIVAWRAGVPVTHYYPRKMLWQATLLGLPQAGAVAGLGVQRLWRMRVQARAHPDEHFARGRGAVLARTVGLVTASVFVTMSGIFPAMAVAGPWSHVDGRAVLRAASSPGAAAAQVTWVGETMDDTITRILLDFYRVSTPQDRTIQFPATVADECALLTATHHPAVLSTRTPDIVRRRYACVPAVVVVPAARWTSSPY
jgi:hypothetical protein